MKPITEVELKQIPKNVLDNVNLVAAMFHKHWKYSLQVDSCEIDTTTHNIDLPYGINVPRGKYNTVVFLHKENRRDNRIIDTAIYFINR